MLLQFFNAASFSPNGAALDSCLEVFNSQGFTYYFDKVNSIGCVRLTAVNRTSTTDLWTYGFTGLATISAGDDYSIQPAKPYTGTKKRDFDKVIC